MLPCGKLQLALQSMMLPLVPTSALSSPELLAAWQRARVTVAQRLNLLVGRELVDFCSNCLCRAASQWQAASLSLSVGN